MAVPEFDIRRINDLRLIELTFDDLIGDHLNVYVGEGDTPEMEKKGDSILQLTWTFSIDKNTTYSILACFANVNIDESFTLVQEFDDYYEVTANTGVTVTSSTRTFEFPWTGDELDLGTYFTDGLQETEDEKSKRIISIGKNQTY